MVAVEALHLIMEAVAEAGATVAVARMEAGGAGNDFLLPLGPVVRHGHRAIFLAGPVVYIIFVIGTLHS